MSYWNDLNEHEEKVHKRILEYANITHKHKMEELKYEVLLFEKYEKEET